MRMMIGIMAGCLALLATSCAAALPPLQAETEYITQLVEIRPQMTAALAADPLVCPAALPAINGEIAGAYLGCAAIAAGSAGQVRDLQRLILGREPSPPDI